MICCPSFQPNCSAAWRRASPKEAGCFQRALKKRALEHDFRMYIIFTEIRKNMECFNHVTPSVRFCIMQDDYMIYKLSYRKGRSCFFLADSWRYSSNWCCMQQATKHSGRPRFVPLLGVRNLASTSSPGIGPGVTPFLTRPTLRSKPPSADSSDGQDGGRPSWSFESAVETQWMPSVSRQRVSDGSRGCGTAVESDGSRRWEKASIHAVSKARDCESWWLVTSQAHMLQRSSGTARRIHSCWMVSFFILFVSDPAVVPGTKHCRATRCGFKLSPSNSGKRRSVDHVGACHHCYGRLITSWLKHIICVRALGWVAKFSLL